MTNNPKLFRLPPSEMFPFSLFFAVSNQGQAYRRIRNAHFFFLLFSSVLLLKCFYLAVAESQIWYWYVLVGLILVCSSALSFSAIIDMRATEECTSFSLRALLQSYLLICLVALIGWAAMPADSNAIHHLDVKTIRDMFWPNVIGAAVFLYLIIRFINRCKLFSKETIRVEGSPT